MSQVINIYFDSYDSNKAEEFTIDEGRFSRLQIEIFARTLFFFNIFDGKYCTHEVLG